MKFGTWAPWAAAIVLNGAGFAGAFFVFYGVICMATGETWHPVEEFAPKISSVLAILGTLLVSMSVWFRGNPNPPSPGSTHFTAWVVALSSAAALVWLVGHNLPLMLINGFSILGLSGALFRLLPLPYFGPAPQSVPGVNPQSK